MKQDILTKFNYKRKMWISKKHPLYTEDEMFKKMYGAALLIHAKLNKEVNPLNNYELERLISKGFGMQYTQMSEMIRLAKSENEVIEYLIANLKLPVYKYLFLMDMIQVSMKKSPLSGEQTNAITLFAEILQVPEDSLQVLFRFIHAAYNNEKEKCMQLFTEMNHKNMGLTIPELRYYNPELEYTVLLSNDRMEKEKQVRIADDCEIRETIIIKEGMKLYIEQAALNIYGIIFLEGGELEINGSKIVKHSAEEYACIFVKNRAKLTVCNSEVDCRNTGTFIRQEDGTLLIKNCNIYQSTRGSCIRFWGQKICIEDTKFTDCYSPRNGGALRIRGGIGHVKNSGFFNCEAKRGGGIFCSDNIMILDCSFSKCKVEEHGSAIYYNGEIKSNVQGTECDKCFPKFADIVQYIGNRAELTIQKEYHIGVSTIIDCPTIVEEMGVLEITGGILFLNYPIRCKGILNMKHTRVESGQLEGRDMIILERARGCTIVRCEFDGVSKTGGIRATGTRLTVSRTVFRNMSNGRCIYNAHSPMIEACVFNFCQNGAVHCVGGTIKKCIFVNCRAKSGAGIILLGNRGVVSDSVFRRCVSDYNGGAIDKSGGHRIQNCTYEDCRPNNVS